MGEPARLEARISADDHALLRRAAEIEGQSLADFVVSAARQAAEQTMLQSDAVILTPEDQRRFAEALIDPPPLSPAMKRALDHHKRMIDSA
jgi:uncharacterized protein (DUF1778 family)